MWGCPGTVSHLFIDTWFMACFFLQPLHQHTSHWSWCCFTRSKMFEWKVPCFGARFLNLLPQPAKRSERFISFIAEKQRVVAQYMRKLIPNITVLKMPFAFPQMNLCFASHSSIHLRFFFSHLRQLQLDLQKFNLKNKIRIGWYGRWCTRTAIPKLGRNQQSTTFSLQHSFPQKYMEGAPDKNQRTLNFCRLIPKKLKVLPIQFTHNFGMYLEHTSILYKKTSS